MVFSFLLFPVENQIQAVNYQTERYSSEPRTIFDQPSYLPLSEMDSFANVVIFVRFKDENTYQAPYSLSYYQSMYNGIDQVSLRDYYLEVSYNQLTIDSYLMSNESQIVFYDDIYNRNYYQPYQSSTNPNGYDITDETEQAEREHALFKRAIDFVDASGFIDSSVDLDTNDDGDIDSLSFLVSGEDDGWESLLWPHQWELYSYWGNNGYTNDAPTINGVYAYTYTMQLLGNTTTYENRVDVFVLAHEMFHVLGAQDLYHYYDYLYIDNVGPWGLMDYNASIPPHMLGYMKENYGNWISSVTEIRSTGSYTLYPLDDSPNNLYRIDTGYSNEYIYLEYRHQSGYYESQLPDSGLLVYRVDYDHNGQGNSDGYYWKDGNSSNEVFLFRPGILDNTSPITFPINPTNDDFDGDLTDAALSNFNPYNSAGGDSEVQMFYSDGTLMDIEITNVIEHDGYITFDVIMQPSIQLVLDGQIDPSSDIYLWNDNVMNYQVEVLNIGEYQAYYTLDGSIPTSDSFPYVGPIHIDALHHLVKVSIYDGQVLINSIQKDFEFTNKIESSHDDYGDMINTTWIITPNDFIENFSILFDSRSELEEDYDYLYVTYQGNTDIYTGTELSHLLLSGIESTVMIKLVTDEYLSDYYGFSILSTYNQIVPLELNGDSMVVLNPEEVYNEQGATIDILYRSDYTLRIDENLNPNLTTIQLVYYFLIDNQGMIAYSLTRSVYYSSDNVLPTFDLIENQTIEIGSADIDWSIMIMNEADNSLDELIKSEQSDFVNYNQLGQYTVTVAVTDLSGNVATWSFQVTVVDTTQPILSLNPGLDSIFVGDQYTDYGIHVFDYSDTDTIAEGSVDVNTIGVYVITYTVTDEFSNQSQIVRYVHVNPIKPSVTFILGTAKTTLFTHESYVDGSCNVQINNDTFPCIIKANTVNSNMAGTYSITYAYTYMNIEYTYKRYVFVIVFTSSFSAYIKEEEVSYL